MTPTTPADLATLSPAERAERNARLHELLGHCAHRNAVLTNPTVGPTFQVWWCPDCNWRGHASECKPPDYYTDHAAAHGLGRAMEERGLWHEYAIELRKVAFGCAPHINVYRGYFNLAHLPPGVRAEAALRVLEGAAATKQE